MSKPRRSSMLGFSRKSSGSVPKIDLTETAKEKDSHRIHGKTNPSKALSEKQPAFVALEKSTLESIRDIQHRDAAGNLITDPDRSNPTRPRLERPLDTIRSFEAAIDGTYNRRPSSRAAALDNTGAQNRRSSYQGYNGPHQRSPVENGGGSGYYGNRNTTSRPDSYVDNYGSPPIQHNQGRRFGPRVNSDPTLYGQNSQPPPGVYPSHGHQQSYDTVASSSGNASHATDQWGNSTDPSSENSSIDKVQQAQKPEMMDGYNHNNGYGGAPQYQSRGPILEEHGHGSPAYGQPGYGHPQMGGGASHPYQGNRASPPAPPPHSPLRESAQRVPIKLGNSGINPVTTRAEADASDDKRKSWLKRRFSKA